MSPPTATPTTIHHTATLYNTQRNSNTPILSTALIRLSDRSGNTILARALLDNGSQICLISENISQKLDFKCCRENLPVKGVGGSMTIAKQSVIAKVHSQVSSFITSDIKFFVLPRITLNLPQHRFNINSWNLPNEACLADPCFNQSNAIDVILGVTIFYELLLNEQIRLAHHGPILRNTHLGWIIAGELAQDSANAYSAVVATVSTEEIYEQLARFWELESCRTKSCLSIEESTCESIFEETTTRDRTGKFCVKLPKKEFMLDRLGKSKVIATKRFLTLERRLNANLEMKALYTNFIREYLSMGHMKAVDENEEEPPYVYYMPHHAVVKPDSTTTKLRVVFDASCDTDSGVSLNDILMVGPVVQDDLLPILIRFRLHKFAIVGDVEKMYRMVNVHAHDQPLQRILWRDTVDEPIRSYQLTTVTYGTSSAPYLATRCLQKCADKGSFSYPIAANIIKHSFYVDDLLTGAHTVNEGTNLCKDVYNLLSSAGFNLRKWHSNNPDILKEIPDNLRDDRKLLDFDTSNSIIKTLGLSWEPAADRFWFKTPCWPSQIQITHRTVLSDAARLFDPYGLAGPVIVMAKLFLQTLWKQKYSWDEPLSQELTAQWLTFRNNLNDLDKVSVPRWIMYNKNVVECELHGFCDASERAYGAAIYLRCIANDGKVTVRLIMAKSKVAPLEDIGRRNKKQTIPRLELSSALLLAHLYEAVTNSLNLSVKAFFWTDSMIVKCWLSSHPSRWQVFVGNRVSEIQHLTRGGVWKHVAGTENPADVISRGMTPSQLIESTIWWNGPSWLQEGSSSWPVKDDIEQRFDSASLEENPTVSAVVQISPPSEIFALRSCLLNLVRLTALLRRFAHNCRARTRAQRTTGLLTTTDHNEALLSLVRLGQSECFPSEITDIAAGRQVRSTSRLRSLNPILIEGLLCVGGRLQNAQVSYGRKHPMILDSCHPLTKLILIDYHHRLQHGGPQLIISCVRELFWPIKVKNLAKSVVHECVTCFKAKPRVHEQLMGDLPAERVTPAPPFLRTGMDYVGPFNIQYSQRKGSVIKCYICIFICLVIKAVHVEIVADLTTEAFLAAFRRFVARRGKPEIIMCDNATNFVGARRQLSELNRLFRAERFRESVIIEAAKDAITFKFIPAKSPNFGGLWESAVKSLKGHMRRVIGNRTLRYDEMVTVVTQIEACLNSRPLTQISNDSRDLEALTPGHFLIQRPLTAIPEPSLCEHTENRLSRWQRVQHFTQMIWKRWSTDYLSNLHNRNKWTKRKDNVHIGTMVLLKEDNVPPLKWHLGRITEIHPGSDGNIRVVSVRTQNGTYRRAISKICILPILDNQQ